MSPVLFLFLDGVGIGNSNDTNPFYTSKASVLPFYHGGNPPPGTVIQPADATLGIEGIPQSASGQTSLFTGVNIPRMEGHRGSFPGPAMRRIIYRGNLLKNLNQRGKRAVFINAYPYHGQWFHAPYLKLDPGGSLSFSSAFPSKFKRMVSVSSCMMLSAGQIPFDHRDIEKRKALYQDFTNRSLVQRGAPLEIFEPGDAADILLQSLSIHHLVLYEFFQTDIYAHRKGRKEQETLIRRLDRMVRLILEGLPRLNGTLVIASDHGNLEDSSSPSHTTNPVPVMISGPHSRRLSRQIRRITDVTPVITDYIQQQGDIP